MKTTRWGDIYTEEEIGAMIRAIIENEEAKKILEGFLRLEKCELSHTEMIDLTYRAYCKAE